MQARIADHDDPLPGRLRNFQVVLRQYATGAPPVRDELRADLLEVWGALRPEFERMQIPLATVAYGRESPIFETALQEPDGVADWIEEQAIRFALQQTATAIGRADDEARRQRARADAARAAAAQ